MSCRVTQEDILSLRADAAALSVEISLEISHFPVCQALAAAGGKALAAALRAKRFIPVGSAVELADCGYVHRAVLTAFDRNIEDYALTVGSVGIDAAEADEMLQTIKE